MIIRTNQGMKPLEGQLPNNPFKNVQVKRGFNQTPEQIRQQMQNRNLMNTPKPEQTNTSLPSTPQEKIELMKQVSRLNK